MARGTYQIPFPPSWTGCGPSFPTARGRRRASSRFPVFGAEIYDFVASGDCLLRIWSIQKYHCHAGPQAAFLQHAIVPTGPPDVLHQHRRRHSLHHRLHHRNPYRKHPSTHPSNRHRYQHHTHHSKQYHSEVPPTGIFLMRKIWWHKTKHGIFQHCCFRIGINSFTPFLFLSINVSLNDFT
jgi:hypothetical protein